jgi:hypothetical protein
MIKRLTNLNKVVYEDPHRQFYHKNALDLAFSARTSPASWPTRSKRWRRRQGLLELPD